MGVKPMQSKFFDQKTSHDALGYFGGSLFSSAMVPMMGAKILGISFGLSFVVGGLVTCLPHLALQLYLDRLLKMKKLSPTEHQVCTNILYSASIVSSAALGAAILGHAILPAVMASGIGVGILFAVMAAIYLGNKLYQHYHHEAPHQKPSFQA